MKSVITTGISNSGKTTWAKGTEYFNINRDDIRTAIFSLTNPNEEFSFKKWNFKDENIVTEIQHFLIKNAFDRNKDIVISDTNTSIKMTKKLINFLKSVGYDEICFKIIDVPVEVCLERDNQRTNMKVGENVIREQYERFLKMKEYILSEGYTLHD